MPDNNPLFFQLMNTDISAAQVTAFNYPYLYKLNPLTAEAVNLMQSRLMPAQQGQMFAVLVVKNSADEFGYLFGFSGTSLVSEQSQINFVPNLIYEDVVIDLEQRFLIKKQALNHQKAQLEKTTNFAQLQADYKQLLQQADDEIKAQQAVIVEARKQRKKLRSIAQENSDFVLLNELNQQSIEQKKSLQVLKNKWQKLIKTLKDEIDGIKYNINASNDEVNALNDDFFSIYNSSVKCLNCLGEGKSLLDLFSVEPVQGAADEAIVKLLNYAFKSQLQAVSFAQFWWGPSSYKEVRHHGRIYPVSQTKCKPILRHMLLGVECEADPLLVRLNKQKQLNFIYQDESLIVINKPVDLLSVPGVNVENSVYSLVKQQFPNATGPLIVHRLDMATSGLMVIALDKNVHKQLQAQFINRTVEKRYVALLQGVLEQQKGKVVLPLRPDLEDRPRQVVCDEYGRYAETDWQCIEQSDVTSRVYFYPKTGRSHQLRMHAAHSDGLNMPIVGDELYGYSAERLHLHADVLGFIHPVTKENHRFEVDADF